MGGQITRCDFEWSYTAEPHATRRKEILAKYPEIKKLMGSDPIFKYQILLLMSLQLSLAYIMRDLSWTNLFIASYCLGAVATHGLIVG
ncbi:unnamed protein product, partial [Porites evermanni]